MALVVEGDSPQAFGPLPDRESGDGTWRAAFALPSELAEPGALISLHDGVAYRLEIVIPGAKPADAPPVTEPAPAERAETKAEDPRARKLVQAWSEAGRLREQLSDREQELADALQEVRALRDDRRPLRERAEAAERELADARARQQPLEGEIDAAREELAAATRDAAAERSSHEIECSELREALDELRAELEKLEEAGGGRRFGRRRRTQGRAPDDQEEKAARTALEEKLTDRQRRIDQLEREAESFSARRDDAMLDSLRDHVGELERELRQQERCADDLRALRESEREQAARARGEAEDLRRQLAGDGRSAAAKAEETPAEAPKSEPARDAPPWSALDDELLARIEKAKSLTS